MIEKHFCELPLFLYTFFNVFPEILCNGRTLISRLGLISLRHTEGF
jgi:hypothetical protein